MTGHRPIFDGRWTLTIDTASMILPWVSVVFCV